VGVVRTLSLIICSLITASAFAAEVYRSVDENGIVVYSDRPDGETNERIVVVVTPPAAPAQAAIRAPHAGDVAGAPTAGDNAPDGGEILEQPSAAEVAEERRRNCELATERTERYRVSHRLYRNLPNGEREYLSDQEITDARATSEDDVGSWCS